MTESQWSLVMDRQGLTISGDRFKLTTSGSEPMQMDEIISELTAVTRRTYGQYCGLSRALEIVGERWGMLIVRDLLVEPKSIEQLHESLAMLPVELLDTRLRELQRCGVVRRQAGEPDGAEVYELTEYGSGLEEVVLGLGRWGAMTMDQKHPEEIVTVNALIIGMRATFRPAAARGVRLGFELRISDVTFHTRISDGTLEALPGPLPGADLIIEPGLMLKALLNGDITAADALANGDIRVTGDPALLDRFVDLFRLPEMPTPANDIWQRPVATA